MIAKRTDSSIDSSAFPMVAVCAPLHNAVYTFNRKLVFSIWFTGWLLYFFRLGLRLGFWLGFRFFRFCMYFQNLLYQTRHCFINVGAIFSTGFKVLHTILLGISLNNQTTVSSPTRFCCSTLTSACSTVTTRESAKSLLQPTRILIASGAWSSIISRNVSALVNDSCRKKKNPCDLQHFIFIV